MANEIEKYNGEIIIYQSEDGKIKLDVRLEEKTVWLTIDQMAELYGKARSTINEHILNAYKEKEIEEAKTMRKIGNPDFSTKPTNYYNLDVIISVGYRVKSVVGTHFRKWATERLTEYMEKIISDVRNYVQARWEQGATHGVWHWDRVYENGMKLLTPEVNPLVVGLFAYLHDSCRRNDGRDPMHGPRAAKFIDTIRTSQLAGMTDEEIGLLKEACRLHTSAHKTGNPTIDACFDADRLDLWRVGITPDPNHLATEKGKEIARSTDYEALIRPWRPS